jgi:hypothetical protein
MSRKSPAAEHARSRSAWSLTGGDAAPALVGFAAPAYAVAVVVKMGTKEAAASIIVVSAKPRARPREFRVMGGLIDMFGWFLSTDQTHQGILDRLEVSVCAADLRICSTTAP